MLTGFTAAEYLGLRGWERDWVDVLAPPGATRPTLTGIDLRLHRTRLWHEPASETLNCQRLPLALVIAARTFTSARPASGLLAAAVQQRLCTADALLTAVASPHCTKHKRHLRSAMLDIAGGSQALSEIDFVRLCRWNRLPAPLRQSVRVERSGRRRYLDAIWRRADGRTIVVEVDGALHLNPAQWWDDQQRQNELALSGDLVLRFPSMVLRTDEPAVVRQLRRALLEPRVMPSVRHDDAGA